MPPYDNNEILADDSAVMPKNVDQIACIYKGLLCYVECNETRQLESYIDRLSKILALSAAMCHLTQISYQTSVCNFGA